MCIYFSSIDRVNRLLTKMKDVGFSESKNEKAFFSNPPPHPLRVLYGRVCMRVFVFCLFFQIKASMWMCQDFPLSLEHITPMLEVLSMQVCVNVLQTERLLQRVENIVTPVHTGIEKRRCRESRNK